MATLIEFTVHFFSAAFHSIVNNSIIWSTLYTLLYVNR